MSAWPEVTTEQIVARLRMIVAEPEKWCETDRHFVEDAADEIERLRRQVCKMSDERTEMLTAHGKIVETLIAERDDLRRKLDQFVGDFKDEVQREAI